MTAVQRTSDSERIHSQLDHPVIDADGHSVEFMPAVLEYLREFGGAKAVEHFTKLPAWYRLSPQERLERRVVRPPWWALPTKHTIDHATSIFPKLLEERMGEMGLDFTVLYPSIGLGIVHIEDEDVRRAACRAFNTYQAELFKPHAAKMTPAAAIPMHTPEEALDELNYAVDTLGMKTTMMAGHVRRAAHGIKGRSPHATWIDNLALDSAFDYDKVWARCEDLGVTPAFHSGGIGWGSRTSVNNYMYNHIGHFAAASEALCKALFFGGVTARFPQLNFMFLEAGVGWAVNLFADIISHWEKRNGEAIANYRPESLDRALMEQLFNEYASPLQQRQSGALHDIYERLRPGIQDAEPLDDFAAADIHEFTDLRDRFSPNFFFGCEADDRVNALAFDRRLNPFGTTLSAVFSSDIGHWDVPDMREVLEEAWELVEDEIITQADFKDFVFTNPMRLFTRTNPHFFDGTVIADAVPDGIGQS